MMPEMRIAGGLILVAIVAGVWIVVELIFGKGGAEMLFGGIGSILAVLLVGGILYGLGSSFGGWIRDLVVEARERLWLRDADTALRVLLLWHKKGARDAADVEAALRALPDFRLDDAREDETALHVAVRLHSFLGDRVGPVVAQLLAAGADPNARGWEGRTPLQYAEHHYAPPELAEQLRAAGAR